MDPSVFAPFDLGHVLQTAGAIKAQQNQAQDDVIRRQFMQQQSTYAANREQREQTQFSQEQRIENTKMLHAAAADVMQNPEHVSHWTAQLKQAGIVSPDFDESAAASMDPEQLKTHSAALFESTGAALAALDPKNYGDEWSNPERGTVNGKGVMLRYNRRNGVPQIIPGIQPPETPTEDQRNFEEAAKGGYKGSFYDYQRDLKQAPALARSKANANDFDADSMETVAQMIAKGEMAPPSSRNALKPDVLRLMSRVHELNPQYDAKDFPVIQRSLTDFTSGKSAQAVTALNVGLQHLDTYGKLADALGNGDIPAFNRIGNFLSQQTGAAAPTNVTTAKQLLAGEITKIIAANGGTGEDRAKAESVLASANSPAQLKGAVSTIEDLFGGRLKGLELQYRNGTKRDDFGSHLSPAAQRFLSDGLAESPGAPAQSGATAPGTAQPNARPQRSIDELINQYAR